MYDITKGAVSANMGNMSAEKSRPDCIKDAELNPILMADHKLENSASEKYLGERINEKVTAGSITKTIDNRIPGLEEKKVDNILALY